MFDIMDLYDFICNVSTKKIYIEGIIRRFANMVVFVGILFYGKSTMEKICTRSNNIE